MSNLIDVKALRNRMLSCNKSAKVSIDFLDDDLVDLWWNFDSGESHFVQLSIGQLRTDNRIYERAMHKAKRDMRNWS